MESIRNSVKAIIIKDGKILLVKYLDENGPWYTLPGGGQEKGEELKTALDRECIEEISCKVDIGDIKLVREYFGERYEFSGTDFDVHQVEFYFEVTLADGEIPRMGDVPDNTQTGIEWVSLRDFAKIRCYPLHLASTYTSMEPFPTPYTSAPLIKLGGRRNDCI